MFLKNFKPLFYLSIIFVGLYFIHLSIFNIFELNLKSDIFNYSLEQLYIGFSIASIVIIAILIIIKQKNIDLVGNVFLLLTCIKMVAVFLFIRTSLNNPVFNHSIEKWNYFTLFFIYLIIETITTIFILNKKKLNF